MPNKEHKDDYRDKIKEGIDEIFKQIDGSVASDVVIEIKVMPGNVGIAYEIKGKMGYEV